MPSRFAVRGVSFFLSCLLFPVLGSVAQPARPLPHPIDPPPFYEVAEQQGTRAPSGVPGADYWQNYAVYDIDAVLSPATKVLRARGRIVYYNESPNVLDRIYLHLRQNLHQANARRNREVSITGGMAVGALSVGGVPLVERADAGRPGYDVNGTIMRVELPEPLMPGDSVALSLTWSFTVPTDAPRMGEDGEVFYLGFWYPQLAVYDDVMGWNVDQYMGFGEFYMGYADYDVRITVPEQWLVAATGELQNPDAVLSPMVRERLASLEAADSVVHVVTADERGMATIDAASDVLTWHFRASQVRDFAFGTSADYVWDAALAQIEGRDPAVAHALYRPGTAAWEHGAEFVRWSVEWLSERLTPYPYPHMTSVEGIISGGMEYPMITLIGGNRTPQTLFRTTFHEVAHMWYPMMVGQNEKAFAWMDEGLVSFLTDDAQRAYWDEAAPYYQGSYSRVAGTGTEMASMRHSDQFPLSGSSRVVALYGKPSVALHALRGLIGDDALYGALHGYADAWNNRHPYPWDLFRSFNQAIGQDLDWFWSAFLFETWTLDHAIASVTTTSDGVEVVVEDLGYLPLPATVEVSYADGRSERQEVPVAYWLSGETSSTLSFSSGAVTRVTLDPDQRNPDLDRGNDVWEVTAQ